MMETLAKQLFDAGGHYTVSARYRHPSTASFLSSSGSRVLDLEKTVIEFERTLEFIVDCGENKKTILFVGTRDETSYLVKETAKALSMPYITKRWIGGLLSNFSEIRNRFQELKQMEEEKESGVWERRHTKKECLLLNKKYEKINTHFGGVASLSRLPDAVFILDPHKETVAMKEAIGVGVPVIGFTNGNTDLSKITYKILANNTAQKSVSFVLDVVRDSYLSKRK